MRPLNLAHLGSSSLTALFFRGAGAKEVGTPGDRFQTAASEGASVVIRGLLSTWSNGCEAERPKMNLSLRAPLMDNSFQENNP